MGSALLSRMEIGSLITALVKVVVGPIVKGGVWASRKVRHALFRWRNKKPPLDVIDAIRAARSTVGGSILTAISFRNLGSKSTFLAVARKTSDEDWSHRVIVLEQVGGTYIPKWISDELSGHFDSDKFIVADIDQDGCYEVAFELDSYGSGSGSRSLYVYSLRRNMLSEVSEHYNYSDASAPDAYPIRIEAGDDEQFRAAVIKFAHDRGLLQGNEPIDYDLPKFAILRWHKENGDKRTGCVRVHFYAGQPVCGNSIEDQLDTGEILWTAYFKGPLYGYIKAHDRHFIAYSPQCVYDWPIRLTFDGKLLWFICHCVEGLFSYECETHTLRHYCGYDGRALPLLELMEGDWTILAQNPNALMQCQAFCNLNKPHLPPECSRNRYNVDLDTFLETLR